MAGSVRHDAVADVIADYTVLLAEAAGVFHELVLAPRSERAEESQALGELAHEADQKCAALTQQIARTFPATSEREDMFALLTSLDDAIDALAHAATMLVALDPPSLPAGFVSQVAELESTTRSVSRAVDELALPPSTRWFGASRRDGEAVPRRHGVFGRRAQTDSATEVHSAQVTVLLRCVQEAAARVADVVRTLDAVTIR